MGKTTKQVFCVMCAHDIKTEACPHPWSKPFDEWPPEMLYKLTDMLDRNPSPGS